MKTKFIYIVVLAFTILSCNNDKAIEQQKWDQMMVIHDEVMPLDSEIKLRARDIRKQFADSTLDVSSKAKRYEAVQKLELSDSLMWKWMYAITPINELQSSMTHEEIVAYLDAQILEISTVSELMKESMQLSKGL